jgi:hypothetical protein
MKFTPPSLIKATPTEIVSNQDEVRPTSFSNVDDAIMTSPSQSEDVHDNYSTPTNSNPPDGKTTAVIAVMRVILKMVTPANAVISTVSKN